MEKNLKLSSKVIQAPEISNPRPWLPWVGVSCSNQSHRTKKEPTSWFGVQLEGGPRDVDSPPTGTNRELRTREQEAQSEVGKVRGSEWGLWAVCTDAHLAGPWVRWPHSSTTPTLSDLKQLLLTLSHVPVGGLEVG